MGSRRVYVCEECYFTNCMMYLIIWLQIFPKLNATQLSMFLIFLESLLWGSSEFFFFPVVATTYVLATVRWSGRILLNFILSK